MIQLLTQFLFSHLLSSLSLFSKLIVTHHRLINCHSFWRRRCSSSKMSKCCIYKFTVLSIYFIKDCIICQNALCCNQLLGNHYSYNCFQSLPFISLLLFECSKKSILYIREINMRKKKYGKNIIKQPLFVLFCFWYIFYDLVTLKYIFVG